MTQLIDPASGALQLDLDHPLRDFVASQREQDAGFHVSAGDEAIDAVMLPDPEAEARQPRRARLRSGVAGMVRELNPVTVVAPYALLPLVVFTLVDVARGIEANATALLLPNILGSVLAGTPLGLVAFLGAGVTRGLATVLPGLGYLADRYRIRRWFLRIGVTAQHFFVLLLGMSTGRLSYIPASMGSDVSDSVRGVAQTMLADYYPIELRLRAQFFIAKYAQVATALSLPLVGLLAGALGWQWTLIILAAIGLAVGVLTWFVKEPPQGAMDRIAGGASESEAEHEQAPLTLGESWRMLLGVRTLRRIWIAFPFVAVLVLWVPLANIFLATRWGLGPAARSYAQAGGALVGFASLVVLSPLLARVAAQRPGRLLSLAAAGAFTFGALIFAVYYAPTAWMAEALVVLSAAVWVGIIPAISGIVQVVVPARARTVGFESLGPFVLITVIFFFVLGGPISTVLNVVLHLDARYTMCMPIAVGVIIGSYLLATAAPLVEGDARAAIANALADEEARRARAAGANKIVVCRGIDVHYSGAQVLFGVDLDVNEGEILALLGTNGAGKSTLMRAIAGIHECTSGAVFLDGLDITHTPPNINAHNGVVFVPGGHAVFPNLTVAENLRAASWLLRKERTAVREATEEVLTLFPILRERLEERAGNMSGGEQQMLALGQAFLMRPRLLMIDELSLGLAPQVVEQLLDVLRRIHAQGTTIVIVEQSINVALAVATRAVFMEKGQVRYDGPAADLLEHREILRSVFLSETRRGSFGSSRPRRLTDQRERVLDVTAVTVSFGGVRALRGVDLTVDSGEVVGIVGSNGAGKTTLFDAISGFIPLDSGRVSLGANDVTRLAPDARSRLGLCRSFQSARLFPALTVRENIAVALERSLRSTNPVAAALWLPRHRTSERRAARRVEVLVEGLGLEAYGDKFINELSTGTRRIVDIACIMAAAPKLLLLDEPSSGLAQAETEELGPFIGRVSRELGCAIVVIEHDLPLIATVSEKLVAMHLGEVIATGAPDDVLGDPDVRRVLVGESRVAANRSGLIDTAPVAVTANGEHST